MQALGDVFMIQHRQQRQHIALRQRGAQRGAQGAALLPLLRLQQLFGGQRRTVVKAQRREAVRLRAGRLSAQPLQAELLIRARQMPVQAAAAQRSHQARRLTATQQKIGFLRRLFQRFKQRVGRRLGQLFRLRQPNH